MAGIKRSSVCIVIPAYNEEKNIGRVVTAAGRKGFRVLVVDDGSSDRTAVLARSAGAEVLVSPVNQGKGLAIRRGLEWFLGKDFEVLILMDADGQHNPDELDLFLEAFGEESYDGVVGNRMDNPRRMPWVRRLTNHVMSWTLSVLAGQKIPDSQCGYRAFRRKVVESLSLRTARFEIESEMLLQASRANFRIGSVPVSSVYCRMGKSEIHVWKDTLRFVGFIVSYFFSRK